MAVVDDLGADLPDYRAFMLRLWREQMDTDELPAVWRFSLDDIATGQRHGFSNLDALMGYLSTLTGNLSRTNTLMLPPSSKPNP